MTKSIDKGLDLEYLKSILRYNPKTGYMLWLPRPIRASHVRTDKSWNTRYAGTIAGRIHPTDGHRVISIDGFKYQAGPLTWFHIYGIWPDREVDHIDRDKDNNRKDNLRLTEHQRDNVDNNIMCVINGVEMEFITLWREDHHHSVNYSCARNRFVNLRWNPTEACLKPAAPARGLGVRRRVT